MPRGGQLLLDWLRPRHPRIHAWPATSTAGALLKREGLVAPRRRRRPSTHPGVVDPITTAPNDLWTCDFKGQFRTQDRVYCYPLTIADLHCRFFLRCHGLRSVDDAFARPVVERTFRFQFRLLYLATALDNFYVGLEEVDDGIWSIHVGTVLLARFDERERIIHA